MSKHPKLGLKLLLYQDMNSQVKFYRINLFESSYPLCSKFDIIKKLGFRQNLLFWRHLLHIYIWFKFIVSSSLLLVISFSTLLVSSRFIQLAKFVVNMDENNDSATSEECVKYSYGNPLNFDQQIFNPSCWRSALNHIKRNNTSYWSGHYDFNFVYEGTKDSICQLQW